MHNHIKNKRLISGLLTGLLSCLLWTSAQAAGPLWSMVPAAGSNPSQTVPENSTATVQYVVQNQSGKPKQLVIQPLPGISQTAPCPLAPRGQAGSSCILNLTVSGSALPAGGIHGGPALCQTNADGSPNPNQCYQPAAAHILHIIRGTLPPAPPATISVSPSTLNLTLGGPAQSVTLSNISETAAENLQVTIPGTSAVTVDAANTTCTSTLEANSSCQYSFLPGAQTETNTLISIDGSNTTGPVTVTVNVSAVVLELSPTTLSFAVGGTSDPITVTNTSTDTAASNLQVNIPPGSELVVDASSTCAIGGSLAASTSCEVVLTTAANAPTEENTSISIQGANTNAPTASVTTTATSLEVTAPGNIDILDVDGTSTISITVENTGSTDAINVQMSSPWVGVDFNPVSCGTIAPGAANACTFTISTSTPNIAGQVSIQGSNTNEATTPFIAFRSGGGLVFSREENTPGPGDTTIKVVTEADIGPFVRWDPNCPPLGSGCTNIVGGTNKDNGVQNTQNIVTAIDATGTPDDYAAKVCSDHNGGGFSNWYLPAICEIGGTGTPPSGGCSIASIYDNLYVHGFPVFVNGTAGPVTFYWSSTEFELAPEFAWELSFPSGSADGEFSLGPKNSNPRVRCVRAFNP